MKTEPQSKSGQIALEDAREEIVNLKATAERQYEVLRIVRDTLRSILRDELELELALAWDDEDDR